MKCQSNPIFVHSDLIYGLGAARRAGATVSPKAVQQGLHNYLTGLTRLGSEGLIFPAFNYSFGRIHVFDVENDPVEVGALPEWVRQNGQFHRSQVPFFSMLSGCDLHLAPRAVINPFDASSGFQWLVDNDAVILLLGAPLDSLTIMHYVEEMSGKPLYRYDKCFAGEIWNNGIHQQTELCMHVRPAGMVIEYDWLRLEQDLSAEHILQKDIENPRQIWLSARTLVAFWLKKLNEDPFYFLTEDCAKVFKKATKGGHNRLVIEDFEHE